jgi:hypothetical protein
MKHAIPKISITTRIQWWLRLVTLVLLIVPCCIVRAVNKATDCIQDKICMWATINERWYIANIKEVS